MCHHVPVSALQFLDAGTIFAIGTIIVELDIALKTRTSARST